MEFELSSIFSAKVVTKNIVLGPLGIHCMHMRVKLFLYFHLCHTAKRLQIFVLRSFGLGRISYVRIDGRKDIQSVKSAFVIFTSRA